MGIIKTIAIILILLILIYIANQLRLANHELRLSNGLVMSDKISKQSLSDRVVETLQGKAEKVEAVVAHKVSSVFGYKNNLA
jgi:hypothetical protein